MVRYKVKRSVINKIKQLPKLVGDIADTNEADIQTVLRWLRKNERRLVEYTNLKIISNKLKLKIEDIICEQGVEEIS